MSDDPIQRPYRASVPPPRNAPGANPNSANDPLAELARLIGQNNSFASSGRDSARHAAPPAAPSYDANDYHAASTAPDAAAFDPPVARRPYANASYAAGPDPYHADNEVPGYPGASADGYHADPYRPDQYHPAAHEDIYDDAPPPRRRVGILVVAAVFALAVIGTAGAFGYRALYGSSGTNVPPPVIKADATPSKIVPASANKTPGKLITDRVADLSKDEKLVSREEQPVVMKSAPAPQAQGSAPPAAAPAAGTGVLTSEPKKIHTIAIRPDQAGLGDSQPMAAGAPPAPPLAPPAASAAGPSPVKPAAPPARVASNAPVASTPEPAPPRPAETRAAPMERQAASPPRGNAPLSLSPDANNAAPAAAPRTPMRTAAAAAPAPIVRSAPPASGGSSGSYVQVSSQRSEVDAQSAFRGLQAKYPSQLGNRQPVIRKVELGAKGTYYRAMVGPLAGNDAATLCNGLKAAGAACLIQRN